MASPAIEPTATGITSLPDDLPPPVARFYRELYGDEVPVIETAMISGRGRMRIAGITVPVRFRFLHAAGHDYRHHIQTTFFGLRLLTVDEFFVDGAARLELPGVVSQGPKVDQAANLSLWAEAVWMPAVWVTDPRARWEPVDEQSALLTVPSSNQDETFIARFDPDTGLLRRLESMRYKGEDSDTKTLWINEVLEWADVNGRTLPLRTALTWLDDGSPWATLRTDEVLYNTDVASYIESTEP